MDDNNNNEADRLTKTMKQMSEMMGGFANSLLAQSKAAEERNAALIQGMATSQKEKDVKIIGTMPKLTGFDANSLKSELSKLERYFDDAHVTDKRTWFRKCRNNLKQNSNCEAQFDHVIAHDIVTSEATQFIEKTLIEPILTITGCRCCSFFKTDATTSLDLQALRRWPLPGERTKR